MSSSDDHQVATAKPPLSSAGSEYGSSVRRKAGIAKMKMFPASMDDGYVYRPAPPPPPPRIDSVIQQIRRNLSLDDKQHQQAAQQQYNHQIHVLLPSQQPHHQEQTPPALPVKLRPKNLSHGSTSYLADDDPLPLPPPPPAAPAIGLYRHHPSFDLSSCIGTATTTIGQRNGSITSSEDWRDSRCSSWSGKHYSFSCPQHLCQQLQYSSPSISSPPNTPDQDLSHHPLEQQAFHYNYQADQQPQQQSLPPQQQSQQQKHQQQQFVPTPTSLITSFNGYNLHDPGKPPLPPKKKSVMEYMQMVGTYRGPNDTALNMYRHSMQAHHSNLQLQQQQQQQQNAGIRKSGQQQQQPQQQQHHMHLSSQTLRQVDKSFALNQAHQHQHSLDSNLNVSTDSSLSSVSKSSSGCESMISRSSIAAQHQHLQYTDPPPLPCKSANIVSLTSAPPSSTSSSKDLTFDFNDVTSRPSPPPPLPPKTFRKKEIIGSVSRDPADQQTQQQQAITAAAAAAVTAASSAPASPAAAITVLSAPTDSPRKKSATSNRIVEETKNLLSALSKGRGGYEEEDRTSLLHELDVSQYLIIKSTTDDGPEIRGGMPDALLVKAAEVTQNEFLFQEAFLATFRTFVTPKQVIDKLLFRYNKFISSPEATQKVSRNAFVLLVRVVDDLCLAECTDELMNTLLTFVCQLVQRGDHALAKVLRNKTMEKMEARKVAQEGTFRVLLPSISVSIKVSSLLDFKSLDLAEQMTIIDSHLFAKVEVAEALVWAKEQREEVIPNLTKFTEHFNNMSYWVRTRILQAEEQKERERICMKFIKIMRNLKKLSNFNSIFAILSALDSAPIRRLDWPRSHTEGMKEFASLIDSSSSFRAYRQVLADTLPPCIPYIGLILQDLTFVHIGNDDLLPDGNINFCKRWLQFNILDQMRRFRNSHYPLLKKNDEIINFFSNFEDYLHEESLWQISECIKPRGGKK